ncbi:hypothetical protein [Kytococcus sedentarius]|uniref:hypothetical protein n=1 Tax=Kytococcus sedentarius TaxID=1276 RepID=UPI00384F3D5F
MARSASVWRLPWTPVTGSWLKNMADLMGHAPVGSDPLSGFFAFLLFIPLLVVFVFWLVEIAVELVLLPFFLLVRAFARGRT